MSWPTVIWSMVAAACITMALPHLIIGTRQRGGRVHLFFALAGFATAWMAAQELSLMRAVTTQESGRFVQIAQVPTFLVVVAIVGFVQLYFGTGRLWLGVLACGLRAVCLVANFADPPNMNFREVTALRSYQFLGETVTKPTGPRSPWLLLAYVSSVLFLAFVIDASWKLWQKGTREHRRRAAVVGGSIVFFIMFVQGLAVLINADAINLPYPLSIGFMAIVAAMGFELSYDVVRAAQLSQALRESEERMCLAAESARLSMWSWDIARDEVWMTNEGRSLLGFKPETRIDFAALVERVHPEDRAARATALRRAVEAGGSYEMEYRLLQPDGSVRWIAARGRCANGEQGSGKRLLGVSMDITARKHSEQELAQQRNELAHLSRVATVSELSGSLAHELNQPLGAMLVNTDSADLHLQTPTPKLDEVRAILADIRKDGLRAGEIIHGMRAFLRRKELDMQPLEVGQLARDAVKFISADAVARKTTVGLEIPPGLPRVIGDRVHLQQVLLNLLVNAMDAMSSCPMADRHITIRATRPDQHTVEIAVSDAGVGIPPGDLDRIFTPFHTTKHGGLGLGLPICRSIVEAHGGSISIKNNSDRGTTARFSLPVVGAVIAVNSTTDN